MRQYELNQKIDEFLEKRKDEIVSNIVRLVNIESVAVEAEGKYPYGEGPARALDEALSIGASLGFEAKNYDYQCGSLRYGTGEEEIGFFSHVDVVPAGNNWTYSPFDAKVENGYIIGRGSNDDKGPAMTALYAMLCCKELGIPLKHSLRLVLGCNEENGMPDLPHYFKSEKAPVFSIIADAEFPVCYAEKGMLTVTLKSSPLHGRITEMHGGMVYNMVADEAYAVLKDTTADEAIKALSNTDLKAEAAANGVKISAFGKATHAAWPEGSVNAIRKLAAGLAESGLVDDQERDVLKKMASYLDDYYGEGLGIAFEDEVTGKLTHVAGKVRRLEDGALTLNFNIRHPVCVTTDKVLELVKERAEKDGFTIEDTFILKPVYVDPESDIVKKLTGIYNDVAGDNRKAFYEGGFTYARVVPNAVAYGPHFPGRKLPFSDGRGKEHMPDECMSIQNIMDAIRIYVRAIIAIDEIY